MAIGGMIRAGVTQGVNWILLILLFIFLAVIVFFIVQILTFKHKFRVRQVVNGRKIVIDDKAREYIDKEDKNTYWQLLKLKQKIPIPPPEAIDIDKKGKKVVEAYQNSTGEFSYINDKAEVKSFEPLTTNQRLLLINQIKKAQSRKTQSWKENLPQMVFAGAVVIILVSMMVFWGDIAAPALSAGSQMQTIAEQNKITAELLKEIKMDIQVIRGEEEGMGPTPPPN